MSIADKLTKANNGVNALPATLATNKGTGVATADLNVSTGWPQDSVDGAVHFTIFKVNTTTNLVVAGTQTFWKATLASNTLSNMTLTGGTNQNYTIGDSVLITNTPQMINDVIDAMKVGHDTVGAHRANLPLTTPQITTSINDANGNEVIDTPATASAVNQIKVTNSATGNDPRIEVSGGDAARNLNLRGKGLAKTVTIGAGAALIFPYDFVLSGCILTGTGYASTLGWSLTSGVVVINGSPLTYAGGTGTVVATKDTYFDLLDNGDGTAVLVNTGGNSITVNNPSPALASNSIRVGIIQSGANIASVAAVNQGEEYKVLPIASSIPYQVTDSLGNLICPRDPQRKIIGYRQIISDFTTTGLSDITGLNLNCIIPAGRKVKVSGFVGAGSSSVINNGILMYLYDVTAGSQISVAAGVTNPSGDYVSASPYALVTPSVTTKNYKAQLARGTNAATAHTNSTAIVPSYLLVELV